MPSSGKKQKAKPPPSRRKPDSDEDDDDLADGNDLEEELVDDQEHAIGDVGDYLPKDAHAPRHRTNICVLLWLNPLEFIITLLTVGLVFGMLIVYPESMLTVPAAYWFLMFSLVVHAMVATRKPFSFRFIFYLLVLIVGDILMIVFMAIPHVWVTGSGSTASAIITDSIVIVVIYSLFLIFGLIRLILAMEPRCCTKCTYAPRAPQPRYER